MLILHSTILYIYNHSRAKQNNYDEHVTKAVGQDTKQLDEYEPEFVQNLKGLAENEYEFQLSKKRLAEAEYAIQFSETPPCRERVLDRWTLDRWTEH